MTRPQLWVFAGPNGSGKSTLAVRQVRDRIPIVNPDVIALGDGAGPPLSLIEAGRAALMERRRLLDAGATFAVETTMTGNSEVALLRQAKERGYKLNLLFVGLADVQISLARVQFRVRRGGHDVPEADILRRFDRSFANLRAVAPIADRLVVIDNSGLRRRLLLWREDGRTRFAASALPDWVPRLD